MTVAVLMEWENLSAEQYEKLLGRMQGPLAHACLFRAAGPAGNGWRAIEVWDVEPSGGSPVPALSEELGFGSPRMTSWEVSHGEDAALERVRASRRRLVAAHTVTRSRLERELHDGVQQYLAALKVKLALAESLAERDPARMNELLAHARADADAAADAIRELALGLYPSELGQEGAAAALATHATAAAIPVTVHAEGVRRYAPEIEAAVYFACLEALEHALTHAGATAATVRISERDGALTFGVEDDGGSAEQVPIGLQAAADRIEALGGSLQIAWTPGTLVRVRGTVPASPAL